MGKLVMGYWDCPVCGTKEIRGDVQNCPACGRARGDVKFYMKNYTEGEIREENERGDIEYLSEDEAKYVSKNVGGRGEIRQQKSGLVLFLL